MNRVQQNELGVDALNRLLDAKTDEIGALQAEVYQLKLERDRLRANALNVADDLDAFADDIDADPVVNARSVTKRVRTLAKQARVS